MSSVTDFEQQVKSSVRVRGWEMRIYRSEKPEYDHLPHMWTLASKDRFWSEKPPAEQYEAAKRDETVKKIVLYRSGRLYEGWLRDDPQHKPLPTPVRVPLFIYGRPNGNRKFQILR